MKKILYWVTFPIVITVVGVFALLGAIAMFVMAAMEKWEDFCIPASSRSEESQKELEDLEARARMRRNIHKNGNPP